MPNRLRSELPRFTAAVVSTSPTPYAALPIGDSRPNVSVLPIVSAPLPAISIRLPSVSKRPPPS
ncbi:hypothetical protein Y033_5985 [Burkholderia pseudomallei MSHR435]|nr:hypothetical protein Y033_5985 [Burkholderia pseudomallei MSHR435]